MNQDKLDDIILILEEDNTTNRRTNPDILNLNPRRLLILFNGQQGYIIALSNDNFIPSANDEEAPNRNDHYIDTEIDDKSVVFRFVNSVSMGSWLVTTMAFSFRYENERFQLIEYYEQSFNGHDPENITSKHENYIIAKTETIDEFGISTWKKLPNKAPIYLDEISIFDFIEK